ncbi:hypothetical protein K450DRAFT_89433 [Umbelopsis ramanniana AG]|uniref:Uncharacterized protein n=1 Tax=Umbelopsis ramanniana AG TaxID=1314678 RepID=A0AAD5E6T2_UMBRA|nr:uncharacterized protein K450DRAFT_89433 [Umbelopsis ramanniana AG]KAI8578153.1 hypothetical protein K450DRAFT_89433 [Umbelopsis ramanniana AG]
MDLFARTVDLADSHVKRRCIFVHQANLLHELNHAGIKHAAKPTQYGMNTETLSSKNQPLRITLPAIQTKQVLPTSQCRQAGWPDYSEEMETIQVLKGSAYVLCRAKGSFQNAKYMKGLDSIDSAC